jgi:hypothetical protein
VRKAARAALRRGKSVFGIPTSRRRERRQARKELFELFETNDPHEEIRRLKGQDEGF